MEKPQSKKKTTYTGRRSGLKKDSQRIFIVINDENKAVSHIWNMVKTICSRRKETAAETAGRVFLRGLIAELEEIHLATHSDKPDGGGHPDLFL
ncbi:MAG: hypothetical protein IKA32_05245 [Lentisphaeria bacterium]|nr:hypothetical protein [Lentisphaeria bacterium]